MRLILLSILILYPIFGFSQAVNIDGAFIRMTSNSKIIIMNAGPDAFQVNGGGIIMDGEEPVVQWNDVNTIGTYMVPFAATDGTTIPFTYEITNITGTGNINFNSHETSDDNLPLPTGVTHLTDDYGTDNSLSVIDRYWIIDPDGYVDDPDGNFIFTYAESDLIGNFVTEVNLTAQRFNDNDNLWLDWLYAPTANTTSNTVSIVVANPLDHYNVWTLADINDPLPIKLIRFVVDCEIGYVTWVTATETNTSHYIIQGSDDAYDWKDIDSVEAAGNSNQLLTYTRKVDPYEYYRLHQFDLDGGNEYSDVIYGCIDTEGFNEVKLYPSVNDGRFFITHNSIYQIDILDMLGNLIFSERTTQNYFDLDISNGKYIVRMWNEKENHTFKFIKIRR